jgi:hypothetical protein
MFLAYASMLEYIVLKNRLMKTPKKEDASKDVSNVVKTPPPPQVMDPSKIPGGKEKKDERKNKQQPNTLAPNEEL